MRRADLPTIVYDADALIAAECGRREFLAMRRESLAAEDAGLAGQRCRDEQTTSPSGKQREQLEHVTTALDARQLQDAAFDQGRQIGVEERCSATGSTAYCFGKAADDEAIQVIPAAQRRRVVDPGAMPEGGINKAIWFAADLTLRERPTRSRCSCRPAGHR
ncbi:MAG: hypothetical protein ACRDRP_06780 [Pseudonocardiaceae bacterium]